MTRLQPDEKHLLRHAVVPAAAIVPCGDEVKTMTKEWGGRPSGAAYGRPFRRPGRVPHCAHHQCWEPTPLAVTGDLGRRGSRLDDGVYVPLLEENARRAFTVYRPTMPFERWEGIRPFVEDAVAVIAPACFFLAERIFVIVSHYVDWIVNVSGYPAQAKVVFHPVMIRRYVSRSYVTWGEKTRRDYRSFLLRVSEVVCPDADPVPFAALNRQAVTTPYTALELDLLDAWARGQCTALRRRGAGAILALGTGAGLEPYEIQHLRRRDIHVDADGAEVTTPGTEPRTVPVLARWDPLLLDAIVDLGPDDLLLGRGDRDTAFNIVTAFLRNTSRSSEPDPVPVRMRTTWLVSHLAARTPARLLMAAAGLKKPAHLAGLLAHIPDLNTTEHRHRVLREARG